MLSQLRNSTCEELQSLSITAVVRKQSQIDVLKEKNVEAVLFPRGLDDAQGLAELASQHDIVVHCASGFHPASSQALIRGLARRETREGMSPFYIQVLCPPAHNSQG